MDRRTLLQPLVVVATVGVLGCAMSGVASAAVDSGDITPPTRPLNLTTTAATRWSVSLGWDASTDSVGVAGYRVYKDGLLRATTTATAATVSNVGCGTTQTYAVEAFDAAGNTSPRTRITASTLACASTTTAPANPMSGAKLYVNPKADACVQATAWRSTRPADAALLDKICAQPTSKWFGYWSGDVASGVDKFMDAASANGALPVLVAYNIYQLGSAHNLGASSPDAYKTWIDQYVTGIGGRRAVVILEPDAFPQLDLLNSTDRQTRLALLRYAVDKLSASGNVAVYLHVGSSGWHPASETASWMNELGMAKFAGFALNVAGFEWTSDEVAYGNAVSALVGGKHFVVSTSRNGLGPGTTWCNPPGRALGPRPTTSTGYANADAFLWIKYPGQSDGTCNGGPASGFWPDYAVGLAARASW
jgi:endoglucanase